MAANGLVFVVLFAWLVVASCAPDGCHRLTQQMLANPCAHLELEISTPDKQKLMCGSEVPITILASHIPPKIAMESAKTDKFYTLVVVDPDAPNHKFPRYWLHWICANIKAKDLMVGVKTLCGTAPAVYSPPTPPQGTGVHRYQFYMFEQKSTLQQIHAPPTRAQFEVIKFVNDLGLCAPPAAAFEFKTQAPKK